VKGPLQPRKRLALLKSTMELNWRQQARSFSETSLTLYPSTWHHILEDLNLSFFSSKIICFTINFESVDSLNLDTWTHFIMLIHQTHDLFNMF